jgi:hypothetical protein
MISAPTTDRPYEERLLTALLDDFDQLTLPDAPAARRTGPVRSRRRIGYALAPALLSGAAAVAVVATSVGGHGDPAPAGGPAAGAGPTVNPDLRTASFVVAKMKAATAGGPYVVVETGNAPDSTTGAVVHSKSWFLPGGTSSRDEIDDAAGRPVSAVVSTSNGDGTTRVVSVDYAAKTWSVRTYSDAPAGGPAPLRQTPAQNADRLRADQLDGRATLVGPATIDGEQTLELREGSVSVGQQLTWVDADTYLPVREIDTAPGGSATSDSTIQTDDQWLPATADNVKLITAAAAIPSGFTEIR